MATASEPAVETPGPFYEQRPFLWANHRYYGYISGVGAGKTFAGIVRTALNADLWNRGEMGAIIAPTTTMIKDVIIPQMREFGLLDSWDYKGPHADEPGLHTPEGGRILLLSADNRRTTERLAGLNLAYWWLDEAARVDERAMEILTQRLRVGNYQNGYITTTPMGRDYLFDFFVGDYDEQREREHGEGLVYEHERGDRLAILRVPTWANPHTPQDYKEQMQAKEGQIYEREIEGRFVDYEGLVYPWFTDDYLVDERPAQNVRERVYGVDWGTRNPSVILLCERYDSGWLVADEFYSTVETYDDLAQAARSMTQDHGPGVFYCDPSEPEGIEQFRRAGLNAQPAENDVQPGIKSVNAVQDQLRVMGRCTNLSSEFRQYRYKDDSEEPVKANDHALDALRYCLHTHMKRGGQSLGMAGANRGV